MAIALVAIATVALAYVAPAQAHGLGPGLRSTAPSQHGLSQALAQTTGLSSSQVTSEDVCPAARPGYARCAGQALVLRSSHALVRPHARRHGTLGRVKPAFTPGFVAPATASSSTPPLPGTPAYLQQAYDLAYLSQTGGGTSTVAIVDAYSNTHAESDLGVYRATYGLPACTTANGCFTKVNQTGGPTPPSTHDAGWAVEESLDLDAVSALCPKCRILLVEANSAMSSDLAQAQATAASLHPTQISDSWTFGVSGGILGDRWVFSGISTVAATGDTGYLGPNTDNFPAAFSGVTAAGGTSLAPAGGGNARGFSEGAWSGASSGCDLHVSKPSWQTDTGCGGRAYADLSADADPATGLSFYDSEKGGWGVVGGTSLAAPLIAAYYAIAGVTASGTPRWAYDNSASLNDPVHGSTGTCAANISYICNAGPGYDGPTGIGSISGMVATGAPGIGGPANVSGSTTSYTQTTRTHGATLEGGIYPNGLDTKWWIEYGTDASYGQQTFHTDIGSGTSPVAVTGYISSLAANTTYHYRLVAQNSLGTTYGYDYSFTTPASTATDPIATLAQPAPSSPNAPIAFNATGSNDPADSIINYRWDFGDGSPIKSTSFAFTGHSYSNPGIYNVTLIVTDSNGESDSTSQTITIDAVPSASFSAMTDNTNLAMTLDAGSSSDSPGTITDYRWNFGDGTTAHYATPSTTHTYATRGLYTITLTVTNDVGQTSTSQHNIIADIAPTASLSPSATVATPGSALNLDANASTADPNGGSVADYSWDFGDHTPPDDTQSVPTETHTYATPGHYIVTLTVTDDLGIKSSATQPITIDAVPSASFSASTDNTSLAVAVDAGSSSDSVGTITDYRWSFGDGSADHGPTPNSTHTYATRGAYTITLTVTNDAGQTSSSQHNVTADPTPTAAFTAPPGPQQTNTPVSFDSGASAVAIGGSIKLYSWNFGDGSTGTGSRSSHAYSSPGRYTVALKVTDDLGVASTTTTHAVTVDAAPAASFSASPNPAPLGPAVAFDARGSSDSLGTITAYRWDFGDGSTGSGTTATHAYQRPGHYPITLTVTNDAGQTATVSHSITVDDAPSPSFSVSPSAARTGTPVGFNAGTTSDSVGMIASYSWNFGDGASASGLTASHTYTNPGSYSVALTVTNDAGLSATSIQAVTVYTPPSASFSAAPGTTLAGAAVDFNAAGSSDPGGAITGYNWNFGDGATANGPSPSHVYLRPGTYTVTLSVTGSLGLATSTSRSVIVNPPPWSARLSAHGRQKLTTVLKSGVVVSAFTNTAAKATFIVTMPAPPAKQKPKHGTRAANARSKTILRTGAFVFSPGTHTKSLRLSRATATKLRTAHKPVVLTLQMTLTDVYGRKATRTVKVKVTR